MYERPKASLTNEPFYHEGDPDKNHACLMLHGLGGGVYELSLLAEELKSSGYSVMANNYPGHDMPAFWMPNSRWEEWFECCYNNYQALTATHEKVSIVGFSTGSTLGLKLASLENINKMVLISPFLKVRSYWYYGLHPETYLRYTPNMINNVPIFMKSLPIADKETEKIARQSRNSKSFNLNAVRSALELIEGVKDELPNIKTPTMIFQSKEDRVVDPWGADYLMEQLGSADKSIHWLNEADHVIPLDHGKEILFEKTLQFLSDS